MRPVTSRSWFESSFYGNLSNDNLAWKVVTEQYYQDHLDQAWAMALDLGVGQKGSGLQFSRMIEAEHITRSRGKTLTVNPWLSVEVLPDETGESPELLSVLEGACQDVASRFGFQFGPKVLTSFLSEDVDAPWTTGRYGYMVDKYPYDKICLPSRYTADPARLKTVMSHEFGHVVALNSSMAHLATWLDEMVAVTAEKSPPAWIEFAQGRAPWLGPEALAMAFEHERRGEADLTVVHRAYAQSGAIGQYLVSLKGEMGMGNMLRSFANNSTWTNLKMAVTGESPVEEALHQTYGFGVKELFRRAEEWVVAR